LGQTCSADRKMSRIMSSLFVLIFFSSGMPVMYLLGTIFFTLTYIINKVLFLQYYQKTETTLSREIPLFSSWMLPLAIIIKLILGIFMYADEDIFNSRTSLNEHGQYALPERTDIMSRFDHTFVDNMRSSSFMKHSHQRVYIEFIVAYILYLTFGRIIYNLLKAIATFMLRAIVKVFKRIRVSYGWLFVEHYFKVAKSIAIKQVNKYLASQEDDSELNKDFDDPNPIPQSIPNDRE